MTSSAKKSTYIDNMGNEITRSSYESLLAQNILEHPEYWKDLFDKFNLKLVEIINYNTLNACFLWEMKDVRLYASQTFPEITDVAKITAQLSGTGEIKEAYANRVNFNMYKMIIEMALNSAWIVPGSHLITEEELKDQPRYSRFTNKDNFWRPYKLFNYFSRGREEITFRGNTIHPGITSEAAVPPKLKSKLESHPTSPAKHMYKRDPKASTIQFMEKNALPFSSGPSGTLGFTTNAFDVIFGKELKSEDYKKLFMALVAHLVYEGHHSFAEIGLIIDAANGVSPHAFPVDSSLKAKEYYDQFLTDEYRLSDAYHKFSTEHNPSKYSAMTWEILRDAANEYERVTNGSSVIDPDITRLKEFCQKNAEKSSELSLEDLEILKNLLVKEEKSEDKNKNAIFQKLSQKLLDSGILLSKEVKQETTSTPKPTGSL